MKLHLHHLFHWNGEISRAPFLVWAAILFGIKYNLDRFILNVLFAREWSVFSHFGKPFPWPEGLTPARNPQEFFSLLVVSIPFLWVGMVLCFKRLRSAKLPLWMAVLFVLPIVKWFLFVILAIVPERPGREVANPPSNRKTWIPKSRFGSAALAVGASVLLALIATGVGTFAMKNYGWALFAGVPFCMGFLAAIIHGGAERRTFRECLGVAILAISLSAAGMLVLAFEGLLCIIMAAPLAGVLAAIGAVVGHAVQAARWSKVSNQLVCVPFIAMPLMMTTELARPFPPPLLEVTTAIEVNATPGKVWQNVVAFAELPPPKETIFRIGIAYPICARIDGAGAGAVRHCVFSTGPFVEPIEVWDEPRLLRFSVTENPAPMQEWTPYHAIHPPHLDGFLVSKRGQFKLTALPGGRTLLQGTTWYRHSLWPSAYWKSWSDYIIHTIHLRVLNHVKKLSEMEK